MNLTLGILLFVLISLRASIKISCLFHEIRLFDNNIIYHDGDERHAHEENGESDEPRMRYETNRNRDVISHTDRNWNHYFGEQDNSARIIFALIV